MSEKSNDRDNCITLIQSLISNENIKQEELYPQWIACAPDRMPEVKQEVFVGWKLGKHKEHTLSAYYIGDDNKWYFAATDDLADWELEDSPCPRPTHWHPIPAL